MTTWAQPEYTDVAEVRGPLLVVRGVHGVGWDEFATIRVADAAGLRHGLVLEVDGDLAVVQVLEGTAGLNPGRHASRIQRQPAADPGRARLARPRVQRARRTGGRRPSGHR